MTENKWSSHHINLVGDNLSVLLRELLHLLPMHKELLRVCVRLTYSCQSKARSAFKQTVLGAKKHVTVTERWFGLNQAVSSKLRTHHPQWRSRCSERLILMWMNWWWNKWTARFSHTDAKGHLVGLYQTPRVLTKRLYLVTLD